jgi:hypothetical protein
MGIYWDADKIINFNRRLEPCRFLLDIPDSPSTLLGGLRHKPFGSELGVELLGPKAACRPSDFVHLW